MRKLMVKKKHIWSTLEQNVQKTVLQSLMYTYIHGRPADLTGEGNEGFLLKIYKYEAKAI